MTHFQFGAIDINTELYTPPYEATKNTQYKCICCNEFVIFKKGEIKKPHFSHYSKSQCQYYDHPNESQIHKEAKLLLCHLLNSRRQIIINNTCCNCKINIDTEIKYKTCSKSYTEYRVIDNNIINIYDVVLLSKNKIKYIFEIYNTHKQNRNCNNWFEIDATELINMNIEDNDKTINLNCIRTNIYCYETFCNKQNFKEILLNFVDESITNINKENNTIDIFIEKEDNGIKYIDINQINENIIKIDNLFNLDWIINVEKQYFTKIKIGNYYICETPKYGSYQYIKNTFNDIIGTIKNNIFLYTGCNKWLKLINRIVYTVKIDKIEKNVWFCESCNFDYVMENTCLKYCINQKGIIYFNSITKKIPKINIINAICENSMILLDDIHRNYINNPQLLNYNIISIKSVAGSGKTTTLLNLAKTHFDKKILYLAYNKSLINEIENKIKKLDIKNLYPMTIDSLIYNVWKKNKNINTNPKIIDITPNELGNLYSWIKNKPCGMKKYYIKHYNNFCKNVEILNIEDYCKQILNKESPFLVNLWNDNIKNKFITYEGLRKQTLIYHFCKNNIDNNYDAIFIDEAQDFDLCMLKILLNDTIIPKIFVGDPKQSIYGFNGCINTFDYLPKDSLNINFYSTFRIGNPACQIITNAFKDLQMFTKNINETKYEDGNNFTINENYTYLFRSWRQLLNTAKDIKNIWINNFEKQSNKMLKLINVIKYMDDDEIKLFEDDLPKFLSSITKNELENLLDIIKNNSVSFIDATCKMYTIHSYKGLEDNIIKIADDLDGNKEENLYYVALTRGKKIIIDKSEFFIK
jgi:hypothetical protein